MELLNSKVDHPRYACDHTAFGRAICEQLGSPRFKLLYDIYHMQVMEGDIIATIRDNIDYISHFHTAGVPGRHEINASQELNYPAIVNTLVDLNYSGYLTQEFIPTADDPFASLAEAIQICTPS
jgi:hydroxypyruvate isomerase